MPAPAPLPLNPGSCEVDCGVGAEELRLQTRVQSRCTLYTGRGPDSTDNQNEECHSECLHSELRLKVFRFAGMLRNIRIILKNVPVLGCCGASAWECIAAVQHIELLQVSPGHNDGVDTAPADRCTLHHITHSALHITH